MNNLELTHRRKNLLTGDWVLVSPHRNNRPWHGATENTELDVLPRFDSDCPLCPGNKRANKESNPDYKFTHVFTNDFGALVPTIAEGSVIERDDLFQTEIALGVAKVVCFSPDHNKTLALLTPQELIEIVKTWRSNFISLSEQYNCVHIFENKGEIMGCSQPHPHGQIWAHNHWSTEIIRENHQQQCYFNKNKIPLLEDYLRREQKEKKRIVTENKHWLVAVPFWAAWPFETLLIAKDDIRHMGQLDELQQESLAQILRETTTRYDNLFESSFPYSMGWHNAPKDLPDNSHWRLHAHFYPPLLRSAIIKKHMVGYEMLAESQRDISAEEAAERLKDVSDIHYQVQG